MKDGWWLTNKHAVEKDKPVAVKHKSVVFLNDS